jgi:HEAT repeat protein
LTVANSVFGSNWIVEVSTHDSTLRLLTLAITAVFFLALAFAGLALLLRLSNNRKQKFWARLEQKWEADTIAVISGDMTEEDVWQRVTAREGVYFAEFLLRFARRLQGAERQILARLARPFLPDVARRLKSFRPEHRARAAQILSILGLPEFEREVVSALQDSSPLVAMIAARALSRERNVAHVETIIANMSRFGSWTPKFLASMLSSLGPDAIPVLRWAFTDPNQTVQASLVFAEALRELHDPQAADLAANVLAATSDREVIAACLRLLAAVGHPAHLPVILPYLRSADFVVRAHAVTALAELGESEDQQILESALDDPSSWVALRAAKGLAKLGRISFLRELAASSHDRATLARQVLAEEGL